MHTRLNLKLDEDNTLSLDIKASSDAQPVPCLSIKRDEQVICQFYLSEKDAKIFAKKFNDVMKICYEHFGDLSSIAEDETLKDYNPKEIHANWSGK